MRSLDHSFMLSLNLLSDMPPRIQIYGNEMPLIVNQSHNVTCLVETCCKDSTVSWILGGRDTHGIIHVEGNEGNHITFVSRLKYDFVVGDEDSQIVCVVNAPCVVSYGRVLSLAAVLDVQCECLSLSLGESVVMSLTYQKWLCLLIFVKRNRHSVGHMHFLA